MWGRCEICWVEQRQSEYCQYCGAYLGGGSYNEIGVDPPFVVQAIEDEPTRLWAAGPPVRIAAFRPDGHLGRAWMLEPGFSFARDESDSTELVATEDGIRVEDARAWAGAYRLVVGQTAIEPGTIIRIGATELRYDGDELVIVAGPGGGRHLPVGDELVLGRHDVSDVDVEPEHCRIIRLGDEVFLEELRNAPTYLRLRAGSTIGYGEVVLLGDRLIQAERTAA